MKKLIALLLSLIMCLSTLQIVHAQDSFRFLAVGDSITLTPYVPDIWPNNCGMGASTKEMDWVHQTDAKLKKHYNNITTDVRNVHWQTNPDMLSIDKTEVREMSAGHPYDLIVIENTDQIANKKLLDIYEANLIDYVSSIKQYNPNAMIIFVTDFLADFNYRDMSISMASTQILNNVAQKFGCHVASLDRITKNPNYMNSIGGILYDQDGNPYTITREDVALHPNDKGMKYIAYKVLEQIGINMDVGDSFADLSDGSIHLQTGWGKEGAQKYYFIHSIKVKGLYNIDNHYYLFDKDTGALKTDTYSKNGYTYYVNNQGQLLMYKKSGLYYNQDTQLMSKREGEKFEALYQAKALLKKIHFKGTKKERLKKCFQYVTKRKTNKKAHKYTFGKTNPALIASEFFNGYMSHDAKVCGFAYLSLALGQKNITIALRKKTNYVKLGKVYYQPNKVKGYAIKVKGPFKTLKKFSQPRMTPVKVKAPTRIVKWDTQKMKLYYDNGASVTGIAVYNNVFYAFDGMGSYDSILTDHLRAVAIASTPIDQLKRYIGEPLSVQYQASCFGAGDDGLLVYKDFIVSTFRPANSTEETFVAVKSRLQ